MSKLTKLAKGQACTVRLPGCHYDEETVVLHHIRRPGTGMGRKPPDWQGCYCCAACHEALHNPRLSREEVDSYLLAAFIRTLEIAFAEGALVVR